MKSLLPFILIVVSFNTHAYDEERAVSNLASDLSECVAYYSLLSMQMEKQNTDATQLSKSGEVAYVMALEISSEETIKARIQLFAKDMMKQINNNWSNGAILM